jgi:Trp operon repressor
LIEQLKIHKAKHSHYIVKHENGTPEQRYSSEMEHLSSRMEHQQNEQLQWRRDKVQELCSKGYSQREIAHMLQVGLATINRDISYLREQAKDNIKRYIDERLPGEYAVGLPINGFTEYLRLH